MLWPAPQRFPERGSVARSAISRRRGLAAARSLPQDAAKPVTLRLKLDYAVCEKLCVPARRQGRPCAWARRRPQDAALAAAEARVPQPGARRRRRRSPSARSAREVARARVVVDVAAPTGTAVDLFAEGPAPDWALPLPGRRRARRRACSVSPSISTALRPARMRRRDDSRSPQLRRRQRSRSPPISTNSPGALVWAPACPAADIRTRERSSKSPKARG